MDADKKKQLINEYKSKTCIGAVYTIECSGNLRRIIKSTTDIQGIKNRYQFSLATKGCPDPVLRSEWLKYGAESFSMNVLEELKMGEEQTPKEFADDIKLLHEMWIDKLSEGKHE